MRAVVLAQGRLRVVDDHPRPAPGPGQLLIRVRACAICRTDLHIVDGELALPGAPASIVLGHQVVGEVALAPSSPDRVGERVGVPWLGGVCGACAHCRAGRENLCDAAVFTGWHRDGGLAEWCVADETFCFPLAPCGDPSLPYRDAQAAPLLCAGLIGWRCLRVAGLLDAPAEAAPAVGLYGFGAAAHILIQVLRWQGRRTYAFVRPGNAAAEAFARSLGAAWAGPSDARPPEELDAALIFAPSGALVPAALRAVRKGGVVVCGGIHMTDVPAMPYGLLWGERTVRSVANLTRRDGHELLAVAPRVPVTTRVTEYALEDAPRALSDLREGRLSGAAVVIP